MPTVCNLLSSGPGGTSGLSVGERQLRKSTLLSVALNSWQMVYNSAGKYQAPPIKKWIKIKDPWNNTFLFCSVVPEQSACRVQGWLPHLCPGMISPLPWHNFLLLFVSRFVVLCFFFQAPVFSCLKSPLKWLTEMWSLRDVLAWFSPAVLLPLHKWHRTAMENMLYRMYQSQGLVLCIFDENWVITWVSF